MRLVTCPSGQTVSVPGQLHNVCADWGAALGSLRQGQAFQPGIDDADRKADGGSFDVHKPGPDKT